MGKINHLCLLLALALLITSCASSKKLLEKGKYDKAIEKSAKKLRKDPTDADELYVLKEAYKQANMFDRQRITFLEKENRDQNWLEVYFLYTKLENRQDIIRSLPTSVRQQFALVNYDEKIIRSKQSAAEAMYQQGLDYLNRGTRESARLAYRKFMKVKDIYQDYKDVNQLLAESRYQGTNFVLLEIENNSEVALPRDFEGELQKIGLAELNTQWLQYETYADTTKRYDYYVVLNISDIKISPEVVDHQAYTDTKEIQDGMKYVLDENGNVKKDSLGNDIRVPKMVTVSASVKETVQHKTVLVAGSLNYVDLGTEQLIKTENLSVNAVFEHYAAQFSGDKRALSEETRHKLGSHPIPFPSNTDMLMDAAGLLKEKAKAILYHNKKLLETTPVY